MRAPSPDMRTGVGPEALKPKPAKPVIREVTPADLRERTKLTINTELQNVRTIKSEKPTYITELEDARKNMLRRIGGAGEETVHELLPDIKEEFIDKRTRSNNPVEVYDFALINDAVTTSSPEDVARTIDVLETVSKGPEDIHVQSFPFREAQDQLCYTLVRQINEIVTNDLNDTRIEEIRRRLERIRNAPRTEGNEILIDHTIQLPLYLTGDEQARIKIGGSEDAYLGKYKNRQFNLDTVEFEKIKSNEGLAEYVDKETGKPVSAAEIETQQAEPVADSDQPFKTDSQKIEEVKEELQKVAREQKETPEGDRRRIDDVIRRYKMYFGDHDLPFLESPTPPKGEIEVDAYAAPIMKDIGKEALPYLSKKLRGNEGLLAAQKFKLAQFMSGSAGIEDTAEIIDVLTDPNMVPRDHMHSYMANHEIAGIIHRNVLALRLNNPNDPRLQEVSKYISDTLTNQRTVPIVKNELLYALALSGTQIAKDYYDQHGFKEAESSSLCKELLYKPEQAHSLTEGRNQQVFLARYNFDTRKTEKLTDAQLIEMAASDIPIAA